MGSSNYYRLWVHDGSQFRELDKFTHFRFAKTMSNPGSMECTAYTTVSAVQDSLLPDAPFRITNTLSTNGLVETDHLGQATGETGAAAGSREIMTGFLTEPDGDEKTAVRGGKPIVWRLSGREVLAEVGPLKIDTTISYSAQTAKAVLETGGSSVINTVGTANLKAGTIDTGPTITVQARNDRALDFILDIATLGDATDDFQYYVGATADAAHSGSFVPKLYYVSSTNALFATADAVTEATGAVVTAARALAESTECRQVEVVTERTRIRNALQVQYQGIGSGTGSSLTTECSDGTSIGAYGRREEIIYAPWIQDSTTADMLCSTLLNTFKGRTDGTGIRRALVTLRKGQLFDGDFQAHLGDTVGIVLKNGRGVNGKMLAYQYSQMDGEMLYIELGLPGGAPRGMSDTSTGTIQDFGRNTRRSQNALRITEAELATEEVERVLEASNVLVQQALGAGTPAITANGDTQIYNITLATPNTYGDAAGYVTAIDVAQLDTFVHDGGLEAKVELIGGTTTLIIYLHTYGPLVGGLAASQSFNNLFTYPFGHPDSQLTTIRLTLTNRHPSQDFELDEANSGIKVSRVPLNTINLSHQHPL